MKTHRVNVRGEKKYCVVINTGEFHPNGRAKEKKFYHSKKNVAIDKANEFLINLPNQKQTAFSVKSGLTINHVYRKLEDDWETRIAMRQADPLDNEGIEQSSVDRLKDNKKALFTILGNGDHKAGETFVLKNITHEWYDQFLKDMFRVHHYSKSKAKRVRAILNNLLEKAEELNWFDSPHHKFAKKVTKYKPRNQKRAMTDKEALLLIEELQYNFLYGHRSNQHGRSHAETGVTESAFLMMLQYPTGMRWGESAALNVEDFDWDNYTLTINKSRDYRTRVVSMTKAGKLRQEDADEGARIVPIAPKVMKAFTKYMKAKNITSGELFTVSYESTLELLQKTCAKVGIPAEIVDTKIFRRYIISKWQKLGVDSKTIALRVGHNDTVTQNGYGTFGDTNALKDVKMLQTAIYN